MAKQLNKGKLKKKMIRTKRGNRMAWVKNEGAVPAGKRKKSRSLKNEGGSLLRQHAAGAFMHGLAAGVGGALGHHAGAAHGAVSDHKRGSMYGHSANEHAGLGGFAGALAGSAASRANGRVRNAIAAAKHMSFGQRAGMTLASGAGTLLSGIATHALLAPHTKNYVKRKTGRDLHFV